MSAHQSIIVPPLCSQERLCALEAPLLSKPEELQVSLISGNQLSRELVDLWHSFQHANAQLANPCFAPEFVQSVAAVRDDVEVAILRQNGDIVGFFPFQRKGRCRAGPVGGIVSDYQGIICRSGFRCDPRTLLKACRLVAWDFDRLLASQSCFAGHITFCEPSAQIDLSDGYEAYAAERRRAGTHQLRDCEYMMRRMARELGPLQFVAQSDDTESLARVLAWKSEQYRRSGWKDLFATYWGRALVERIHAVRQRDFAGMLSLLYAGPVLVAGHMGMRSRTVWHYWFPAYNTRFAKYSPGLVLLTKMAQAAEHLGLRSIDIGTELPLYKKRLMNSSVQVADGSMERPSILHLLRYSRRTAKKLLKGLIRRP